MSNKNLRYFAGIYNTNIPTRVAVQWEHWIHCTDYQVYFENLSRVCNKKYENFLHFLPRLRATKSATFESPEGKVQSYIVDYDQYIEWLYLFGYWNSFPFSLKHVLLNAGQWIVAQGMREFWLHKELGFGIIFIYHKSSGQLE